jgi:hypothetical protein
MRHVYALLLAGLFCAPAHSANLTQSEPVTVLLQFEGDPSDISVQEMKREVEKIMTEAGLKLRFQLLKDVKSTDSFADLVVVKFKGRCQMEPLPVLYDERGPLAYTHTSDGAVLPFSEVACDRIRLSIRSVLWGDDVKRADFLLGRALGRVLAHELYHIYAKTQKHGNRGVAQTALSGSQLIAETLDLGEHEASLIQQR